ncbi:LysE family translocator [Nordella sp. HKS 07]|uniref:LysE family translocator n=1 Tax=Nordella sp. HKS 07 TaxID=2712222 RepID=UPI0013E1DFDD|nr:LysE family translocator [Nordella sp. HKS 07]QIG47097.1 LysE family translocator [Nordella sp. HKS 07]
MLGDLLGVAALTVLIMITPGADLALVTRNTIAGGKSAGGWTSAGIVTGNLVHLTYSLLGVGWLATSATAFTILKLAGGAYLIFLGLQTLRVMSPAREEMDVPAKRGRRWWMQGLLNNLLNPKGPLFYLGVLAVFVKPDSTALYLALLIATTIGISAGFWVLFVYVLQISGVRRRLLASQQWVSLLLGIVLIGLGIRLWLSEAPGVL